MSKGELILILLELELFVNKYTLTAFREKYIRRSSFLLFGLDAE